MPTLHSRRVYQELFSNWIKNLNSPRTCGHLISPAQLFFEFAAQFKQSWRKTCFSQQELYYSNRAADCLLRAAILQNHRAVEILKKLDVRTLPLLRYVKLPEQGANNATYQDLIQLIKRKWINNTEKQFSSYTGEDSLVHVRQIIHNILEKNKEGREDYYLESAIFERKEQILFMHLIHTTMNQPWSINKDVPIPSNDELLFEWANELKFYYHNYYSRFTKSHYSTFSAICLIISAVNKNISALLHLEATGIDCDELNQYSSFFPSNSINDWHFVKRVEKAWVQTPLQY